MHIDYKRTVMSEAAERSRFRSAVIGIDPILSDGSPLRLLADGKEAPAKAVMAHIEEVLAYRNSIFRSYIDPERAALEEMLEYCTRQIEIEKAEAAAKKLVTQAIKAGMKYGAIQRMVVREMDSRNHDWPPEGW